jgi:hypothetical protein
MKEDIDGPVAAAEHLIALDANEGIDAEGDTFFADQNLLVYSHFLG